MEGVKMKLKVKNLKQTTTRFPSQWEGNTVDDQFIYIRYRNGWLEVSVAPTKDELYDDEYKAFIMNDGTNQGEMETDDMLKITGIELEKENNSYINIFGDGKMKINQSLKIGDTYLDVNDIIQVITGDKLSSGLGSIITVNIPKHSYQGRISSIQSGSIEIDSCTELHSKVNKINIKNILEIQLISKSNK
jgi:hypothetical protein